MIQYVHLLQEFLSLGGYDTSFLSAGDTDLVSLKEDENLLVIFNNQGEEDLFMIFDSQGVTITFGQWYETLLGQDFSTFEYLVEIIRKILSSACYVKEIRLDDIEIALLISEETDQIMNSCIISGAGELKELSAFDFIHGLDYSEAYFDDVRWDMSQPHEEDEFFWWDDETVFDEEEEAPEIFWDEHPHGPHHEHCCHNHHHHEHCHHEHHHDHCCHDHDDHDHCHHDHHHDHCCHEHDDHDHCDHEHHHEHCCHDHDDHDHDDHDHCHHEHHHEHCCHDHDDCQHPGEPEDHPCVCGFDHHESGTY